MFKNLNILFLGFALLFSGAVLASAQTYFEAEVSAQASVETQHRTAVAGEAFVLDGSQSADDGTVQTFSWTQVSGPYKFEMRSGSKVSVVPPVAGTYVFELRATDSAGGSSVAERVEVKVSDKEAAIYQNNQTDVDFLNASAADSEVKESGEKGGTEDINIGVGEQKGGNVEFEWKVEEGESAPPGSGGDDRLKNAGAVDGWPAGAGISVSAGDVNGLTEEERQTFLSTVKAHAEIASGQELENFALGVLIDNEHMEEISFNYEKITMNYRARGKFLGFIPVSLTERVEVDTEGESAGRVKVKMPWYSFLVSKDAKGPDLEAAISAEVEANLGNNINWDFGSRASVLSLVSNILKTKHDTAMNSIRNIK